ncbi:hypothetical protein B4589_003240 [Halolamina sp. CBA1230]|uniref:hypothetical protein n=1 Tax=Halolamina sp. CBA1230 TaxID=1853690 RepID=UPI0009A21298|nr:hypothetical protein [Halolamina sp. CBA1230]QKY19440.1 hypothetical protein B4589_003240 [Halolamina sp. CBA1230]
MPTQTDSQTLTIPDLPTLDSGITLLETDGDPRLPLQTLLVDRVLLECGRGVWVGTGRYCTTETLAEIAPDRRVLDRVDVARGFTPYQHTALLDDLAAHVDGDTAVIVLPDIDAQYRGDDVQGTDGRELLVRALAQVAAVAREYELPVLCTRSRADAFSDPVAAAASSTLTVRDTEMGPRFEGDGFETLVYEREDGWVQTTLAFWQQVLEARQPLHDTATLPGEVFASGAV